VTYIQLSYGDLALPTLLVVMDGVLSLVLLLKLEKQLAIATVRMVVQLVLVGYVLTFLFAAVSPLWTALAASIMVLFASREIVARQKRRLPGVWSYGLGAGCTLLAAGTVTMFALLTELRPDPWYHPRYSLPLLGMILGNTMTGISLGLDVLTNSLVRERTAVEACLALGGTDTKPCCQSYGRAEKRLHANPELHGGDRPCSLPGNDWTDSCRRRAGRCGKIPIADYVPDRCGTGLGTLAAVLGGTHLLTDHRHRLRLDRILTEE
jgi:UDP-glucose/iron transport system permease protein